MTLFLQYLAQTSDHRGNQGTINLCICKEHKKTYSSVNVRGLWINYYKSLTKGKRYVYASISSDVTSCPCEFEV